MTTKKTEGCADNEEKHSASGSKSHLSTSQSSSLAGSSELDVWSPIQKHFEEDINQLLSNIQPSKTRHDVGYRSSINILDTERSPKPRTKLVHQIRSDGVLVVARRASSESMSSIFHTNDIQNQQIEQSKITASCSFGDDKADASSNLFSSSHGRNEGEPEKGETDDFSTFKQHKRGLSIKGSCRRQWLRNQSKIDKTKRKVDLSKDNTTVREVSETSADVPEKTIHADDLKDTSTEKQFVSPRKNDSDDVLVGSEYPPCESYRDEKEVKKKKKPRSVKATVEF